ncbi:MAG: hypothetical protein ACRDZ3_03420 [Acidimicrobiia bacterium]
MRVHRSIATTPEVIESAGMDLQLLRSCHSCWYFDTERRRFQRLPRGVDVVPEGEWASYHRLEIDTSGSFMVTLNEEDTSILRSWVHLEPCPHCHAEARTEELKLQALRR